MSSKPWIDAHKRRTRDRLRKMTKDEVGSLMRDVRATLAVEGIELDAEQEDLLVRSARGDLTDAEFDRELRALLARRAARE